MNKRLLILIGCIGIGLFAEAQVQKSKSSVEQAWVGYFNQTRFSDKWGFWVDLQLRAKENFVDNLSVSLNRAGLTYYVTDNVKLTAGYAYIIAYPEGNRKVTVPEHRPWQQIQWQTKYGNKAMMQYIRLEERYRRKQLDANTLSDSYNFNYRLRYNIFYDIPLSKKGLVPKAFSFFINDEVHINFGKEITYNTFDQNRFYVGFKYQLNKQSNIQAGYMNLYQQMASGNQYRTINAARIGFFQSLDLRRKSAN